MKESHVNFRFIYFSCFIVLIGCKSAQLPNKSGNINDAIVNSIIDFNNGNKKLLKTHTIYHVMHNTYDDYYQLVIIGTQNKFLYNPDKIKIESELPSNYYEIENKLFYWYDDTKTIDEKTIKIYLKYDLLVDNQNGTIGYLDDFILDETLKGGFYFICKNDLTNYQKKISNSGKDLHSNLNCNK
jgi:hypothetical protein